MVQAIPTTMLPEVSDTLLRAMVKQLIFQT
jgi:hypothetical protein